MLDEVTKSRVRYLQRFRRVNRHWQRGRLRALTCSCACPGPVRTRRYRDSYGDQWRQFWCSSCRRVLAEVCCVLADPHK